MTGVDNRRVETRCGFVAVLGAPNAGKSTLVNALVGQKVSIVTQKVQTTRIPVRGIAIRNNTQIIFVDTPGIFSPKRRLDRAMVNAAWKGADTADAILVVVDAADVSAKPDGLAAADTNLILDGLGGIGKSPILVLNKVDAIRRELLLPLTRDLSARTRFSHVFMVSAASGEGLTDVSALSSIDSSDSPAEWIDSGGGVSDAASAPNSAISASRFCCAASSGPEKKGDDPGEAGATGRTPAGAAMRGAAGAGAAAAFGFDSA